MALVLAQALWTLRIRTCAMEVLHPEVIVLWPLKVTPKSQGHGRASELAALGFLPDRLLPSSLSSAAPHTPVPELVGCGMEGRQGAGSRETWLLLALTWGSSPRPLLCFLTVRWT